VGRPMLWGSHLRSVDPCIGPILPDPGVAASEAPVTRGQGSSRSIRVSAWRAIVPHRGASRSTPFAAFRCGSAPICPMSKDDGRASWCCPNGLALPCSAASAISNTGLIEMFRAAGQRVDGGFRRAHAQPPLGFHVYLIDTLDVCDLAAGVLLPDIHHVVERVDIALRSVAALADHGRELAPGLDGPRESSSDERVCGFLGLLDDLPVRRSCKR